MITFDFDYLTKLAKKLNRDLFFKTKVQFYAIFHNFNYKGFLFNLVHGKPTFA